MLYTFITVDNGIVHDEIATFDEKKINALEQQWLAEHGFFRHNNSYKDAVAEYREWGHDDDYYIFMHPIRITNQLEVKYVESKNP